MSSGLLGRVLELFEPRWRSHGGKYVRSKLADLAELAVDGKKLEPTDDELERFVTRQAKLPNVQQAKYPPGVACDASAFAEWLERDRRRSSGTFRAVPPRDRPVMTSSPGDDKAPPASLEAILAAQSFARGLRR